MEAYLVYFTLFLIFIVVAGIGVLAVIWCICFNKNVGREIDACLGEEDSVRELGNRQEELDILTTQPPTYEQAMATTTV